MKEQYYIKLYKSTNENFGYNLAVGGLNNNKTEEIKKKISKTLKGKPKSEEHKKNISKHQHLKRKIKCIETQEIFDSITLAGQ